MSDVTATAAARRIAIGSGWLPFVPLIALGLLVPDLPARVRYAPLVASVVVLGLPHGAADLVALPRALYGRVTGLGLVIVGGLYLVLGSGYALLWLVAPVPSAVIFIGLTWAHWGQGDVYVLRELFGATHLRTPGQQWLTALVRGGLPMLVPLLAFPDRYRAVLASVAAPFGGHIGASPLFDASVRLGLGLGFAALTVLVLARGWRLAGSDGDAPDWPIGARTPGDEAGDRHTGDRSREAWWLDAAETGLLWAVFLSVPPVLAVGLYFTCWHSLRHVLRVLLLQEGSATSLARGRWARPLGRFAVETAAPAVAAVALFAGLWLTVPARPTAVPGLVGLYLVGIATLTLPHVVVVTVLDRADGLWGFPAPSAAA